MSGAFWEKKVARVVWKLAKSSNKIGKLATLGWYRGPGQQEVTRTLLDTVRARVWARIAYHREQHFD